MPPRMLVICLSVLICGLTLGRGLATAPPLSSSVVLRATGMADQDDMTFWLHPTDLSQSTIIASDKSANRLFVYDLNGTTLQVITAQQPGNIDSRYGFPLGGKNVDIVAFNERGTQRIRVYKVDPDTRQLVPIDNGGFNSGSNYGFTLYKSPVTSDFYAFTGPESNTQVRQYKLVATSNGLVSAEGPLRQLQQLGQVEGMVADDETGMLYLGEENGGLWKFNAEPNGAISGTKIAAVGQNGLTADVEGVTIYYAANGQGYIIVSSQGNDTFKVYQRQVPHTFRGTFTVSGVTDTDGIAVVNVPFNSTFSQGIFALHNGRNRPYPVELVKWESIATALGLSTDIGYWDPRVAGASNNNPPVATDGPDGATDEDTPVDIHVLSNDPADLDGDLRRVISVTQPSHGSATINADNSVTYTPSANFNGSESFDYTVSDGRGGRDTATVSVMVHAVHDPPVASAQSVTTAPGTPVVITLHATDAENEPLSYEVVTAPTDPQYSGPQPGDLSGTAPNLTYTPDAGYSGPDSFTFWADDGVSDSLPATVSITVTPATVLLATEGFESNHYSGGTGWRNAWTRSGEVSIRTNADGPQQGSRHVRLRASSGYMRRSVNLSGTTNVHLTCWAKVRSFETSDRALVRGSTNGTSFTTGMTFTAAHSDDTYRFYDIDLSSFAMTATFAIAFDAEMSSTSDEWFVDNIQVTGRR